MRRPSLVLVFIVCLLVASGGISIAGSNRFVRSDANRTVAAPAAVDSDSDGLTDADELTLKTDPTNADSDCDTIDDTTEVGTVATPTDTDSDGIIDALENNFADSDQDATQDHQDPISGKQITCARFKPFAILNNNTDTTRIEVRVAGTNVTAVTMPIFPNLFVDGVEGTVGGSTQLFDDGTHGDLRAGDGLWSREGISSNLTIFFGWANTATFYDFTVTDDNGTSVVDMSQALDNGGILVLGIVNADMAVAPTQLQPNVFATSNLLNVVDPLGSVDVAGGNLAKITKQLYDTNVISDSYDFVAFMADRYLDINATAYYSLVRNDVQHIGAPILDLSAQYGSNSKLQGVLTMNLFRNPPLLHELMHHWGTPDLSALGFNQCADSAHWGVSGIGRGALGGFDPASLVDNGNGTYTVGSFDTRSNEMGYAPLELYLAGLIDSGSVADMTIPTNVACNTFTVGNGGITGFSATGLNTVTIGQIQTALGGERVPGVATSQKAFTMAPIIVSQYPLNSAEMSFYNMAAKNLAAPTGLNGIPSFAEGTGERATIDTTMFTPILTPRSFLPMVVSSAISD